MRELDAATGWLPAATTTWFGAGRNMDRAARRTFRRGMDREARRTMHLLFRSARGSDGVYAGARHAVEALSDRPVLTVFGQFGDYLRFRARWRSRFDSLREVTVPWGVHFPMCDAPKLTARAIDVWHGERVACSVPRPAGHEPGRG